MLAICIRLAAAIHGLLAFYMPTNRAVDWLRSPSGLKWAIPVSIVATPIYLFAMSVCMTLIERGGPMRRTRHWRCAGFSICFSN